jgi:hypothetical protein
LVATSLRQPARVGEGVEAAGEVFDQAAAIAAGAELVVDVDRRHQRRLVADLVGEQCLLGGKQAEVLGLPGGAEQSAAHVAAVDLLFFDDLFDEGDGVARRLKQALCLLRPVALDPGAERALAADGDHAAVAAAPAPADRVRVEHGDRGAALGQIARRREAGDTGADDGDVDRFGELLVGG